MRPRGIEGPLVEPGSAEWRQTMSASKVAAVVGLSPWESHFSLHHRMAGTIPWQAETDDTRRGVYLEDGVAAWFADEFPEFSVTRSGTWTHAHHPWMTASPDRLLLSNEGEVLDPDADLRALLEIKTSNEWWAWGEQGTDQIPPYYRCQVIWQMDVTGIDRCYVAVLLSSLEFAWYVVDYDADEALWLRLEAEAFLASIREGRRPSVDEHTETYVALRELHPAIEDDDVDLDEDLARRFVAAKNSLAAAKDEEQLARSMVAEAMGNAKRARFDGHTIASRQVRGDGLPFVVAGRKLPTFGVAA